MMKFQISLVFMVLIAFIFVPKESIANPITDCWNQWSRCSTWSSGANGILWDDCQNHCKCLGYANGGICVEVPSICFLFKKALQCQCQGTKGQPTGTNCL
uniref:Theromacin n=1 Tax=Panagrolaimus sp. PS1159 TaxID=55785 RepID=A0AC35FKA1_9BILA